VPLKFDMPLIQHKVLRHVKNGVHTMVAGPGLIHKTQAARALCRRGYLVEHPGCVFKITPEGIAKLSTMGGI
jgi:hypothetical protein